MKQRKGPLAMLFAGLFSVTMIALLAFTNGHKKKPDPAKSCCIKTLEKVCIFRTLLGEQTFDTSLVKFDSRTVDISIQNGLGWLIKAQQDNGGWGAGSHMRQDIRDPHAVPADPATTSLVAMSLLRTDEKPFNGKYADPLKNAVNFLLEAVENSSSQQINITTLTNTQPQTKLGRNIDVILTAQFFSNALHCLKNNNDLKKKMEEALKKCISKIQRSQDVDGGWKDGGWAPVLQSALANNALESADNIGMKVDSTVLERSRNYQKKNYDVKSNTVVTGYGAGVMLYSVSSSSRASAQEGRKAADKIAKARKDGKLKASDKVNKENLVKAGMNPVEAEKYATAYSINQAAAIRAQDKDVIDGFGSNGGEEFLSYLMTGESLIIGGDTEWKSWYEKMSARLVQVQNQDGSWSGHHCITSPVFCTATCLLVLSIDKDIDFLIKLK